MCRRATCEWARSIPIRSSRSDSDSDSDSDHRKDRVFVTTDGDRVKASIRGRATWHNADIPRVRFATARETSVTVEKGSWTSSAERPGEDWRKARSKAG